jgi:hypothetical protein
MTELIDLSPASVNLKLYSGDGVRFRLIATDKNNAAVNLTGTITAQIRKERGGSFAASAEFMIDLTNAATGVAVLSLTGAQTQALARKENFSGVWDVQWTASDSEPRTLCQGKVEVVVDVSR